MGIGPHLGVYYGKLTLPEEYRTIELETVSLTLPTVQIWIYTNGDFKFNVGWPLGPESINIQVYIFTGSCGFYFGKLRSGDNPQNPNPPVVYNPILEFGLGLSIGVGRSFQQGPFSANLSLTLQGTFQGVLAWKENGDITHAPDYFWFAATVSGRGSATTKSPASVMPAVSSRKRCGHWANTRSRSRASSPTIRRRSRYAGRVKPACGAYPLNQ